MIVCTLGVLDHHRVQPWSEGHCLWKLRVIRVAC